MYELTGAHNYIVPTMIVVLVAKAVGDYFMHGGISEQLILLNGIPFLDNEATLPDIPVRLIMKRDLVTVTANTSTLQDIEVLLREMDYQGFPVVSTKDEMRLVGHIQRCDLTDLVERIKRIDEVGPDTTLFLYNDSNLGGMFPLSVARGDVFRPPTPDISPTESFGSPSVYDPLVTTLPASGTVADLRRWVDTNPIYVDYRTSAETVLEIFR
ncbi:glycerol ethanol, ferric requiring protein, partial [Spiromyces aspiralis]